MIRGELLAKADVNEMESVAYLILSQIFFPILDFFHHNYVVCLIKVKKSSQKSEKSNCWGSVGPVLADIKLAMMNHFLINSQLQFLNALSPNLW